jgi:DNA polymerase III delta prime subunit
MIKNNNKTNFNNIHNNILDKLNYFIEVKKIPNILFHGPYGSGKKKLVFSFIDNIYNNDNNIKKEYTMFVNCAQGKGIKFIRDELKFFAKTNINYQEGNFFKTVILSNADKLTIDAQSAIRRCIEQFAHTTRFFIIIEDKNKLLKPIVSRFSEIFIPSPRINNEYINLYKHNISLQTKNESCIKKNNDLKKYIESIENYNDLIKITNKLYDSAYTINDIINYIEKASFENIIDKTLLILITQKIKCELRNEKIIILFILNLIVFRSECNLESIAFI